MFRRARPSTLAIETAALLTWAAIGGCYASNADPDVQDSVDDGGRTDSTIDDGGRNDGDIVDPAHGTPVDILVLVDYSGGMLLQQAALTQRFPGLLEELIHPTDADGDGRPDHPPVTDIHVGVISQDLGTAGFPVSTCEDDPWVGDDGCLLHEPSPAVGGCESSYPLFLSFDATVEPVPTVDALAQAFTCIATLGGSGPFDWGCGFEQPLEAMRRATTTDVLPGGCNEGFLRPDSLLVMIFLSDEDDCSVRPEHPELFDPDRTDLGHLNIRCHLYPENVTPVADFVAAFRALRPDRPDRLVVGMIVGVPPDVPDCIGSGDELTRCLSVPAMEERLDPAMPTQLIPSCNSSAGMAMPPVRLVSLAQQLGSSAFVGSICQSDYGPTIESITEKIVERLGP